MSFKIKRFTPLLSVLVLLFGMLALLNTNGWPTESVAQAASQDMAPRQQGASTVIISNTSPAYGFDDVSTIIYLNGSGFVAPLSVKLGLTQSLEIAYSDAELIAAIVPAGLEPGVYDVTVEAAGESGTDPNGYEVLNATAVDDLLSSEDWLWTNPFPLRVGYAQSSVGLLVQHLGGRHSADEVYVEFRLDDPISGTLLGGGWTNVLAPFGIESTSPIIWEPEEEGDYTVCAIIDPNDEVQESQEDNNTVCRDLTVLPFNIDAVPPEIEAGGFVISDYALTTPQVTVTLDVMSATDYPDPGGSGLQSIKYVEFEYILGAHRWVPVQRTPWVTYTAAYEEYPWKLIQTFGMRYMQAWIADNAGNISLEPGTDVIDLLPSEQPGQVRRHGVTFYRILLEQGESFTARLTPVDGDPDLYVWGPNGQLLYDLPQTGIEEVTIDQAPARGTYQIEIHGFTDAEYLLEFNPTDGAPTPTPTPGPTATAPARTSRGDRTPPDEPAVPLDDWPEFFNVEAPPVVEPQAQGSTLYLPIMIGSGN